MSRMRPAQPIASENSWISSQAEVGKGTLFHPGCVVGPGVQLGPDNEIGPHAVIQGRVEIGGGNRIMAGVTIGIAPRQRIWVREARTPPHPEPRIGIGDGNIFYEQVSIRLPMQDATIIESHVVLGAHTHIANDALIRTDAFLSPGCVLGGYVTIGRGANLGLGVRVHQRTTIGAYALCGMGAVVLRHVLPGAIVVGSPAKYLKPNGRGMTRHHFRRDQAEELSAVLNGTRVTISDSFVHGLFDEFISDRAKWGRRLDSIPRLLPDQH